MVCKQKLTATATILFLLCVIVQNASADITVYSNTYFTFPSYNTQFNFSTEHTFASAYRTASSNSTYPEYWFITTTSGDTYALHSEDANFTITDFFTASEITFTTEGAGTVNIYTESLGSPSSVSSGTLANYNADTQVATITFTEATTVTVRYIDYVATLTPSATSLTQGEIVTVQVSVTKDGETFTDYILNVTRDEELFKQNIVHANSTFTDQENTAASHTYNVTTLYDSTLGEYVTFTVTPVTVQWVTVDWLITDFTGFITETYSGLIGELWLTIPLLIIFVPLYIKTESIEFCAILWVLAGSILIVTLSEVAFTTGSILLMLGIAIILYRLARRVL